MEQTYYNVHHKKIPKRKMSYVSRQISTFVTISDPVDNEFYYSISIVDGMNYTKDDIRCFFLKKLRMYNKKMWYFEDFPHIEEAQETMSN